jgi:hypothetical protein
MRRKFAVTAAFLFIGLFVFAQDIDKIINPAEVERIEKILSSDAMEGRAVFTPAIERAADFIQQEFRKIGLQPTSPGGTYLQDFYLIKSRVISANVNLDGKPVDPQNLFVISSNPSININQDSGYNKVFIRAGDNFREKAFKYTRSDKNYLVFTDTIFAKELMSLSNRIGPHFSNQANTIFILSQDDPAKFTIEIKEEITKLKLANVVGLLPGKSRKNEYVIFSGHYDHLGIGLPDAKGDSIYNGANDDASGTTAVIMLAKYFKQRNDNERTLVFVAFTAEEIGGYGSRYFSKQYDPGSVVAMFNIEMIGTESKWRKNTAYITGYEKSDMGQILAKNLAGSRFTFYPDPYKAQNLFYRSDNATLARLGVPAHTISTSKMEEKPNDEPNYHKQSDEIGTLDMDNMSEIIKAIAISSGSIISGKDSPTRVDTQQLRN